MVTIKDVARVSGLSTSTVSRVIRGESNVKKASRDKIQRVIDDLGYTPNINAQALVSSKSNTLGVIVPMVSMPFFGALVCGAEEALVSTGYRVVIANAAGSEQAERDAINALLQHKCGAIVFHSMHLSDDQLVELSQQIPGLVFVNRFVSKIAHRCVWLDNNYGAQEAVKHLIAKGHKSVAAVSRADLNPDAQARLEGIKTGLHSAGITIDDELIQFGQTADMDGGRQAASKLLDTGKKFSAILAYNDNMAAGVVHELHSRGVRVPDEVSVVGFDDIFIAKVCYPQLTSMHYPVSEMASYAAKLAIELSENPVEAGRTHLFMPHLVERNSVSQLS